MDNKNFNLNHFVELLNNRIKEFKKYNAKQLESLAKDIRDFLINIINLNGGHLSSNLGVVELTIALHYVFDFNIDKIIFDVGHQCYTHKILTGRADSLLKLRKDGGITGFPNPNEHKSDLFITGHSSTALSLALGQVVARDLNNENYNVIAFLGDGALTGGMCYEALNQIGELKTKMIIILNDNKMSISKNVGAISRYLSKIRLSKKYYNFKNDLKRGLYGLPFGKYAVASAEITKKVLKKFLLNQKIFENFGIKYIGPIDGSDIKNLIEALAVLKNEKKPVLLHVITKKGKGLKKAETKPEAYHNLNIQKNYLNKKTFSSVFSKTICELAQKDKNVVAITAAMSKGTGLNNFCEKFPKRYFDVGIAEEHAVTFSASLAKSNFKPYFAVYSTFLQRAYDQILHDVCINNLPVKFIIDRAGLVEGDGVTHQGLFDLSFLNLPNMTILSPADGKELKDMLYFSLNYNKPLAIRYPKTFINEYIKNDFNFHWNLLKKGDCSCAILAISSNMLDIAMSINNVTVIDVNTIKPLDYETLDNLKDYKLIITMEENIVNCGFGIQVKSYLISKYKKINVINLGFNDFVQELDIQNAYLKYGLTKDNINKIINKYIN